MIGIADYDGQVIPIEFAAIQSNGASATTDGLIAERKRKKEIQKWRWLEKQRIGSIQFLSIVYL